MDMTDTSPAEAIDSHAAQLKSDLKTLRGDIDTLRSDVAALGKNQVERVKANVAEVDESLGSRLAEKPFQTLAVAFAAGYLFAAITR